MEKMKQRLLVIGATGMLGSVLFRSLSEEQDLKTYGTVRDARGINYFAPHLRAAIIPNVNVESESCILAAFALAKPDVVLNCAGIVKQNPKVNDHLESLAINASLPHRLSKYCSVFGARFVHFSTDCVFSGEMGGYRESDFPDAHDLYGRTKCLGEVDNEGSVTLRTSIIGHELAGNYSLVSWFLSQAGVVKGYRKAIFSGLPTVEIAKVIRERVLPNASLCGIYHLSAAPISKYDLLRLIASEYRKSITIIPDDTVVIDRSLNSERFRMATGFVPSPWPELIGRMNREQKLAWCRDR